ncbi:MAG: hypothetical protein WA985_06290, partial [Erythrobacter sp.]
MPTSPATTHTHHTPEPFAPTPTIGDEWRRLARFLVRPDLPVEAGARRPLTIFARLYALDIAIMLTLILAAGIAVAAGVDLPETALAGMEFTPLVVLLVIVVAPVMEELAFRGWLAGRPGQLVALGLL